MICPKCHSINADGMRFCGNCGTALSVARPTQQMPQPQYGQQSPSAGAGAGGQGRGGKGLVIALVAGVATLVVVVAVLAVMLLRRSASGPDVPYDGGSYGTRNADTGKTGPEQTDTSDSGKSKL